MDDLLKPQQPSQSLQTALTVQSFLTQGMKDIRFITIRSGMIGRTPFSEQSRGRRFGWKDYDTAQRLPDASVQIKPA
jgi:hypothetical protein